MADVKGCTVDDKGYMVDVKGYIVDAKGYMFQGPFTPVLAARVAEGNQEIGYAPMQRGFNDFYPRHMTSLGERILSN
eukprot:1196356-Prorocentrum_minimum.AAC.7